MSAMKTATIQCPYCWETLEISIDPSVEEQEYVEDCQVCCQPIVIHVVLDDQLNTEVHARAENG